LRKAEENAVERKETCAVEKTICAFIGRILLAQIFIIAGVEKLLDPTGTQAYMAAKGMPLTFLFFLAAVAFELGGGLSLLLGYKARWGALALVIFLIPTTLIFHTAFSEPGQQVMFMKNLAIMGGLLMIFSFGSGGFSVDGRAETKES
jgi:putative oxidoreductase